MYPPIGNLTPNVHFLVDDPPDVVHLFHVGPSVHLVCQKWRKEVTCPKFPSIKQRRFKARAPVRIFRQRLNNTTPVEDCDDNNVKHQKHSHTARPSSSTTSPTTSTQIPTTPSKPYANKFSVLITPPPIWLPWTALLNRPTLWITPPTCLRASWMASNPTRSPCIKHLFSNLQCLTGN
jgi:hypothetical protein